MASRIRQAKSSGDREYRLGLEHHEKASLARYDYSRLREKNRARFARRGQEPLVADAHFASYAVAKECIDTDAYCSRVAMEHFAAASAYSQGAVHLLEHLRNFMVGRRARMTSHSS